MGWDQGSASNWTDKLGRNLSNNVADASIKAALGQGKLEDNLKGAIVGALGASLATQVGDLSTGDTAALNNFGNKVAHALVGCAMGAASTGHSEGCAAGALGAVIAEATAELYNAGSSGAKPFTKELGQITAIVAAAAAGQDVAVAQLAGANAVENNYLSHSEAYRREVLRDKQRKGMALTEAEARELANLDSLDAERDARLRQACQTQGDACDTARRELNDAIGSYRGFSDYNPALTSTGNAGIKMELGQGLALANEKGLASQTWGDGFKEMLTQIPAKLLAGAGSLFTRSPKVLEVSTDGSKISVVSTDVSELTALGIKFTPEKLIATGRTPSGQVVFIEKGSSAAGLQHIIERHGSDFASKGIAQSDIPIVLMQALKRGEVVGINGTAPVYRVIYNGEAKYVSIGVGSNGYVVRANPVSEWKKLK